MTADGDEIPVPDGVEFLVAEFVSPLLFGVFVSPLGIQGVFVVAALLTGTGVATLGVAVVASPVGSTVADHR